MKFLIDANLPPALALWISPYGHSSEHVDDVLVPPALDEDIWSYTLGAGVVIVTKDSDFLHLSQQAPGPQLVWIRCGNLALAPFRAWFDARALSASEPVEAGEPVVELR